MLRLLRISHAWWKIELRSSVAHSTQHQFQGKTFDLFHRPKDHASVSHFRLSHSLPPLSFARFSTNRVSQKITQKFQNWLAKYSQLLNYNQIKSWLQFKTSTMSDLIQLSATFNLSPLWVSSTLAEFGTWDDYVKEKWIKIHNIRKAQRHMEAGAFQGFKLEVFMYFLF